MTIEEKAKAYDEALERAKKLYNEAKANDYTSDMEDYETIFPELAESEDEKIKESLMQYIWNIYHREYCPPTPSIETCDKWIAWINEKRYSQKDVDDAYLKGVCDTKQEFEKQGEQKPINDTDEGIVEAVKDTSILDMVEPKQEWSEKDEKMTKELIEGFLSSVSPYRLTHTSKEIVDWLKSIKCRMKGKEE